MEMAGGLGPLLALPGVKLATDDWPSANHHWRPPFFPFFFFFPCFFFLPARHHLHLGSGTTGLLRLAEPHRTLPRCRWGPPLAAQSWQGGEHATEPEMMQEPNQLLLQRRAAQRPYFSPPRPPRVVGLPQSALSRCLVRSWEEQTNAAPLSLSFFFPGLWHGQPNPIGRRPGADGGSCLRLGPSEPMGTTLGPNQGESRTGSRFCGGSSSGPLPFPPRLPRVARLLPLSAPLSTWSYQGRGATEHLPCSLSFSLLTGWRSDLVDGVRQWRLVEWSDAR